MKKTYVSPDGAVVTLASKAKAAAEEIKAICEAHYAPRPFEDLSLMEIAPFAWNAGPADGDVLRELTALQNRGLYRR